MRNKTWKGAPVRYGGTTSTAIRNAKKERGECATYDATVCLRWPEEGKVTCLPCTNKRKAYLNKWREQNREKVNEWARKNAPPYSEAKGTVNWYSYIKISFGLSKEQVNTMLSEQGFVCAICKRPNNLKNIRLPLDHDHKTGKARAFLCHRCNSILGWVEESTEILESMIEYLVKHRELGEIE